MPTRWPVQSLVWDSRVSIALRRVSSCRLSSREGKLVVVNGFQSPSGESLHADPVSRVVQMKVHLSFNRPQASLFMPTARPGGSQNQPDSLPISYTPSFPQAGEAYNDHEIP
jgi:hypothetical protein